MQAAILLTYPLTRNCCIFSYVAKFKATLMVNVERDESYCCVRKMMWGITKRDHSCEESDGQDSSVVRRPIVIVSINDTTDCVVD